MAVRLGMALALGVWAGGWQSQQAGRQKMSRLSVAAVCTKMAGHGRCGVHRALYTHVPRSISQQGNLCNRRAACLYRLQRICQSDKHRTRCRSQHSARQRNLRSRPLERPCQRQRTSLRHSGRTWAQQHQHIVRQCTWYTSQRPQQHIAQQHTQCMWPRRLRRGASEEGWVRGGQQFPHSGREERTPSLINGAFCVQGR